MNIHICVAVLLASLLPFGSVVADSTNSAFGITVSCPDSFSFSQQDGPVKTISLDNKPAEQIRIGINAAGIMQPEDLSEITLGAFRKGRALRKAQGDLSEKEIARTILGGNRTGTQFGETLAAGSRWSECYVFQQGDRVYMVWLQWEGSVEQGLPLEFQTIIDSMKESTPAK